jgi:hypothetical protein
VLKKPRERGGHSSRWAAETEKINKLRLGIFLNGLHYIIMSCWIFVASLQFLSTLDDSTCCSPALSNLYVSEFDYSVICNEIRNKKDNQFHTASFDKEEINLPTW